VSLPLKVGENELIVRQDGPCGATVSRDRHIDVVLPLLHGPYGEDGTLQGMLELAGLRYVGCGVTASAVGMDKHFMKLAFEAAGMEVGPYTVVTDRQWSSDPAAVRARIEELGFPVFVKPARAGSSFGITKVDGPEGLAEAVETAREHDRKLVVEAGIVGREIECAVLEGRGTEPARTSMPGEIEIVDEHAFYDFEAKYVSQASARLSCPADLPREATDAIRAGAARAFEAVDGEGLCRADFFYTPDGRVVINEINTMPGFTPISMYPRMWAASGLDYTGLIDELLELALERSVGLR
jgi:D-alanine-D-alanine ligase